MSRFIDKRFNSRHKSAVNRQRFIRRFTQQIKEAVREAISGRKIKQIDQEGEKIIIPAKDINEPNFSFGEGGEQNIILPGNKDFLPGDLIKRPSKNPARGGSQASQSPETGLDEFAFELTKEEFLDIFFEDLALPNLVKTQLRQVPTYKLLRAGYTNEGTPTNINILRSLKGALSRRIASGGQHKTQLLALKTALAQLESECDSDDNSKKENITKITTIKAQIKKLENKKYYRPFIDPLDLKYNYRQKQPQPSTSALMFCLMDVSGSMDEAKKEIAKRFFILLYLFLTKNYENVEIVFIRHHTSAKEVDEEEFFYSRETGGTVVSSALVLMKEIMSERYSTSDWNIYGAQASDGDNWNNDSPQCKTLLSEDILPFVQYFAYVEIMPRHHQSLWEAYLGLKEQYPQFAMQNIDELKDIYPVFRSLFKRQDGGSALGTAS